MTSSAELVYPAVRDELTREQVKLMDAIGTAEWTEKTIRRRNKQFEERFDRQLAEHADRYEAAQRRAEITLPGIVLPAPLNKKPDGLASTN